MPTSEMLFEVFIEVNHECASTAGNVHITEYVDH